MDFAPVQGTLARNGTILHRGVTADRAHSVEPGAIGIQGLSGAHIDKLAVSELAAADIRVRDHRMTDLTTPNGGVGGR